MDAILQELGAVAESESSVEHNVLREKVLSSLRLPETIGVFEPVTVIGGFPELTSESKRALFANLHREINEAEREGLDHALLKLKLLRSWIGKNEEIFEKVRQGFKAVEDSRKGSHTLTLSDVRNLPAPDYRGSSSDYRSRYVRGGNHRGGGVGGGDLGLNDQHLVFTEQNREKQKWNIDDAAIEALAEEAKGPSSSPPFISIGDDDDDDQELIGVERQENNTKKRSRSSGDSGVSSSSSSSSSAAASIKISKRSSTTSQRTSRNNKSNSNNSGRSSSSSSGSSSKGASSSGNGDNTVTCPICTSELHIPRGFTAESVLDKHIDRCSRRSSSSASASGSSSRKSLAEYDESEQHYEEDWMDDDEEEETERVPVRRQRLSRRNSTSPQEDDDEINEDGPDASDVDEDEDEDEEELFNQRSNKRNKKTRRTSSTTVTAASISVKRRNQPEKRLSRSTKGGRVPVDRTEVFIVDDWEDRDYLARLVKAGVIHEEDDDSVDTVDEGKKYSVSFCITIFLILTPLFRLSFVTALQFHGYVATDYGTEIDKHAWNRLFEYQREGMRWMYDLYQRGVGGILGDEMGLGKTAQLCCHFGSLARSFQQARGKSGIFLVVCPATVLHHWLKEMHMWCPALRCVIMHSVSKTGSELHNLGEDGIELVLRRLQRSVDTKGREPPLTSPHSNISPCRYINL